MATVSFSIPEDVKKKFDRAFAGKNKSRVIADLMAQAVEEQLMQKRRSEATVALVRAGLDRNYDPMAKLFNAVIERTLQIHGEQ